MGFNLNVAFIKDETESVNMPLKQHKLKFYLNWKLDFVTGSDFVWTNKCSWIRIGKKSLVRLSVEGWGEARDAMPPADRCLITDDVLGKQLIPSGLGY